MVLDVPVAVQDPEVEVDVVPEIMVQKKIFFPPFIEKKKLNLQRKK